MSVILPLSEQYRQRLRQASWRMQYRAKTRLYHEHLPLNEQVSHLSVQSDDIDVILLREWIDTLPSEQGRLIITGLYLEGRSEQELAARLQISQQAVNRWKRKSLEHLSRTNNL
ncbi:sigma factor-like helix-turn-helix DNA-binding protein [Paenibacillus shenyangensis]|uniref:sigma factor-like helix-turn-helix DNA-binding protein n=1 Tax=Paenibacillus sp. A9 TaxID=1284352 RepID=UPI0003820821|nr:sigma factor-like helix-turn-helix DNA-binding protein [Paenibacillus sp. A9]